MFVLFYKENINDLDSSLPSVVSSLLQKFEYVFLEDGPSGFPPFNSIEHQIDFSPGAATSNQLTYRTNPRGDKGASRPSGGIDCWAWCPKSM